MTVGTLRFEVVVRDAVSLKDTRRAIRSLKDRLKNKFNISVAEVGRLDSRRLAELGAATVSNERQRVESVLSKVVDFVRAFRSVELVEARSGASELPLLGRVPPSIENLEKNPLRVGVLLPDLPELRLLRGELRDDLLRRGLIGPHPGKGRDGKQNQGEETKESGSNHQ